MNQQPKRPLVDDIRALGIGPGDLVHLKISMRSVGTLPGGPRQLLDAFLDAVGPEGTIVSDAFISAFPLPLAPEYAAQVADDHTPTYAGAFCQAMVDHPRMVRSRHPIQKSVAIGRQAVELMHAHDEHGGGYDPLLRMCEQGARHVTLGTGVVGVGTTHVAQNLLELKQRPDNVGRNFRDQDGEVRLFRKNWVGGCGRGFPRFMPLYEEQGAILARGMIGAGESFVSDMKATLAIELDVLRQDPTFMLCDDPGCYYCRLSWDFSTGSRASFYLNRGWQKLQQRLGVKRRRRAWT